MFNYICVLCLCLQGSWPQSVQPLCYYDYVQVCVFPVPVFTGQLVTKFTAHVIIIMFKYVCVLCLCPQGSWSQSVWPVCYYDYVQVCVFPVPVFTGQLATKFTAYVIMIMFKYVCVLCLCLHSSWPQVCNPYVIINLFKYVCVLCLYLQGSWPQSVQPIIMFKYVCVLRLCLQGSWPQSVQPIIMFKYVCVLHVCLQGSWPQSVQPARSHNYVQMFPVPVFTGHLATKCTANIITIMFKYVCALCLCLHGSWPQSVQPIIMLL